MTIAAETEGREGAPSDHNHTDGHHGLTSTFRSIWAPLSQNFFQIAIISVAFFFVGGLFMAVWRSQDVIRPLADAQYARGLITFLVASAAVLIALVLTLFAVTSNLDPEQEGRFNRGKEVLTIFIGVLGTIVGFYFGSTPTVQVEALSTSPIIISNERPKNGETVTIAALVAGGAPPYAYEIRFIPSGILADVNEQSAAAGVIQHAIAIPASINPDSEVTFHVEIKDSFGKSTIIPGKKIVLVGE